MTHAYPQGTLAAFAYGLTRFACPNEKESQKPENRDAAASCRKGRT